MTQDEAEKLASILIARQVPEMNAAGFGWQWSVDIETGRVQLDKGETLTPDLFLAVTTPSRHLAADGPNPVPVNCSGLADGPSFADLKSASLTHAALQSTAGHILQMAAARRAEIAVMDKLAAKQAYADLTACFAQIEAAMKAQTLTHKVVQITPDRVQEMAELWRKQHAASDYHAERVAELEAAMKAQTVKFGKGRFVPEGSFCCDAASKQHDAMMDRLVAQDRSIARTPADDDGA